MGMDTGTLVGRRDAGLVDGTYVNENNIEDSSCSPI